MTDEKRKEFTIRISQANPAGLLVILYEMAIEYINEAIECKDDKQRYRSAVHKARGCVNELINTLNFNYELSNTLLRIYMFANRQLAQGDVRNDIDALIQCRGMLEKLCDSYRQISAEDNTAPVMENSQSIYAGLTYGKGTLNESIHTESNRGFLV